MRGLEQQPPGRDDLVTLDYYEVEIIAGMIASFNQRRWQQMVESGGPWGLFKKLEAIASEIEQAVAETEVGGGQQKLPQLALVLRAISFYTFDTLRQLASQVDLPVDYQRLSNFLESLLAEPVAVQSDSMRANIRSAISELTLIDHQVEVVG